MSSIFQNQTAVLRRAAAALGDLPVRGLVTTGRAIDPGQLRVPANVRAVRAAPHSVLLPLAAAVITHAGHGTVLKALAAAVPLVCMPQGRDQKDNAARVLRLGAGVRVKPGSAPPAIAAAVRTVREDPQYRAAATAAAHQLAQDASRAPSAADETEALLLSAR